MTEVHTLESQLCEAMCSTVKVIQKADNLFYVATPFQFSDGDSYSIYLSQHDTGGWRISDKGSTFMHLSYEMDVDDLYEGTRAKIFEQILAEIGLKDLDGELVLDAAPSDLGASIFTYGKALTQIHDLNFLNRVHVESTFYEDLEKTLEEILGDRLKRNYFAEIPNSEAYPIDYAVAEGGMPLYIFGVSNKEKAKLSTIIIQHLHQIEHRFQSLVVYADMEAIPRHDVTRLTSASGFQIPSLNNIEDLKRKLTEALPLGH